MSSFISGIDAEKATKNFFIKNGFSILFERAKTIYGEIDLIAQKQNLLVFIEVKFRKDGQLEEELVSNIQKKRIMNACQFILSKNPQHQNKDIRFDVVICTNKNGKIELNHIENAFGEDW